MEHKPLRAASGQCPGKDSFRWMKLGKKLSLNDFRSHCDFCGTLIVCQNIDPLWFLLSDMLLFVDRKIAFLPKAASFGYNSVYENKKEDVK